MAFQDFDLISERRRNKRKQKLRRRIAIAAISAIVLASLIAAAVFVVVTKSGHDKARASPSATNQMSHSEEIVKMVCNSTDYKNRCETTLSKAVQKDLKGTQFKDLLKVSIHAAEEEVTRAFNKTTSIKLETEQEKGAYKDCKLLIKYAKKELGFSISQVGANDLNKLSSRTGYLNS